MGSIAVQLEAKFASYKIERFEAAIWLKQVQTGVGPRNGLIMMSRRMEQSAPVDIYLAHAPGNVSWW